MKARRSHSIRLRTVISLSLPGQRAADGGDEGETERGGGDSETEDDDDNEDTLPQQTKKLKT